MTTVSDAPSCGVTFFNHHSDESWASFMINCSTSKCDLSRTTKCDQNHIANNYEFEKT
jgi:hypothetical protein